MTSTKGFLVKMRTPVLSVAMAISVVASLAISGAALARTDATPNPAPKQATCLTIAPIAWMNTLTGLGLTSVTFKDYSKMRAETLVSFCRYHNAEFQGEGAAINVGFYDKKSVNPTAASVWKGISTAWLKSNSTVTTYHPECKPDAPVQPVPFFCTLNRPFGANSLESGPQIIVSKHGYTFFLSSPVSVPIEVLEKTAAAIIAKY